MPPIPRRALIILMILVGGLHVACIGPGIPVATSPETARVIAAMQPLQRTCGSSGVIAFAPGAIEVATRARLYWLGACDEVRVRWSELSYPIPDSSSRLDVCNPTGSIATFSQVSLVKYRAAMLGSAEVAAIYPGDFAGCESPPVAPSTPPPDNFLPDDDYLLQLFPAEQNQLTDEVLGTGDFESPAALLIARVGTMPRRLQPRVLQAFPCEVSDDGSDPCDKRKYEYRPTPGDEVFSPGLRITTIRVVRGRTVPDILDGVEGVALADRAGFVCDDNGMGDCVTLPFEWVQAASDSYRCYNSTTDVKTDLNIREDCVNPMVALPIEATPVDILSAGVGSAMTIWTVNFKASTGFEPPDDGTVLAIQFTVANMP